MNSSFKSIMIAMAIVVACLGVVSFAAHSNSQEVAEVTTTVESTTTSTTEAGPTQKEKDDFLFVLWVNRTNQTIWYENVAEQVEAERQARLQEERAAQTQVAAPSGSSHSDDFLACVRAHESDTAGGYGAQNPTSSASGAYQIVDGTWQNYKGYPTAASAPPHIQDERAKQLPRSAWNGSGC